MALTENETFRLLKEMAEGNQTASRWFYQAYSPIVRKFLLRRGEEPALVEDALQVAMLEVWKHPERYQPGGGASFKTWLLRIASNRLIDMQRKRPDRTQELDEEKVSSEINEGYERVHAAQRIAALRQCMERLKGTQRQLLTLAYDHELPGWEIGEIMGMPEGTVKSTLHYAKGLMRKCLNRLLIEVER